MNLKTLPLLGAFLLAAASASAQTVSRAGTTAAPFLKIGVGGRVLGMGEAGVTVADDATALYWNPAGLAKVDRNQVLLNHFNWIADIRFDVAAVVFPVRGIGAFGLAVTNWGADDFERTTLTYQDGTGEMVSVGSTAFTLSYARSLTDRFSIGFNGKYITESFWHCRADGFAVDVGALFTTQIRNLKLGMSISNFGTPLQLQGRDLLVQHDIDPGSEGNNSNVNATLSTDSYSLPIFFRFGASIDVAREILGLKRHDLIVAVDAVHPNDNREYVNAGVEYRGYDFLALRAGYRQLLLRDREGGPAFGFGLRQAFGGFGLNIDYAALDMGRLDTVHKFSLILSF
jgi:hypothetical protein